MHPITLGGTEIKRNADGLFSLNDLHAAALAQGLADGKADPREWSRAPRSKTSGSSGKVSISGGPGRDFIDFVATNLNVDAGRIMQTARGKGGGTFAHIQVALAYAKYLSPELHMQVNDVFMRAKTGDVTLADEIADKASPEDQAWLAKRVQGKVARSQLTSTLARHGVLGRGFADCTNAIYRPLLGGKKSEVCKANGIDPKKVSMRDMMTIEQLMATGMAELIAAKNIARFDAQGNEKCAHECARAAQKVAHILQ
jgi:hypothetical protein